MVSIIKLTNGHEVIGEVVDEENNKVVINNPLSINYRYKNDFSPPVISLTRYSPFSTSKTVSFKKEYVLNILAPIESMIKYYESSLKNIIQHIDPSIEQELAVAAGESDLSPESQAKLALIERHVTKATLN